MSFRCAARMALGGGAIAFVVVGCGARSPSVPPSVVRQDEVAVPPQETAVTDAGSGASESAPGDASAPMFPVAVPAGQDLQAKDECTPVAVAFEKRARPELKACYAEGKKKDPNLEGRIVIRLRVDPNGKIKSRSVVETTLPKRVGDCMLDVVRTTPFPDVEKCWDSSISLPITFPTPR